MKSLKRSGNARKSPVPSSAQIVVMLDEAFVGPAWHGPSLREALRGVDSAEARWTAGTGRPSIWALTLHATHAKYLVAGRLSQSRKFRFPRPLARQWWPHLPAELDEAHWRADLELLGEMHALLRETVRETSAARLSSRRPSKRHTLAQEAVGMALHDAYHAGQIRLLRKLFEQRGG